MRIVSGMMMGGLLVLAIFWSGPVRAYDTYVMHPALSRAVAEAYNVSHPAVLLTDSQIEWLTEGSIHEDEPALRALNHFYNPRTAAGLRVAGVSLGWASPLWAMSAKRQSERFRDGDCSWERARSEYETGNEAAAFICLGQVLHLLEDASVPAHTRDDQHLEGDPYEQWLKYHSPAPGKTLAAYRPECADVASCIRQLAGWIHDNFVSQDTISLSPERLPVAEAEIRDGNLFLGKRRLAAYSPKRRNFWLPQTIQDEYWQEISPVMVAFGRRLVEIFVAENGALAVMRPVDSAAESNVLKSRASTPAPASVAATPAAEHLPFLEKAKKAILPEEVVVRVKEMSQAIFMGGGGIVSQTEAAAPDTYITQRPASRVRLALAQFRFASSRPGSLYECRVDEGGWQACPESYGVEVTAEGDHDIAVRAREGNTADPTPAEYRWTLDTTAPLTLLFPMVSADGQEAAFRFFSEADVAFHCQLDDGAWEECQSPQEYVGLSGGTHRFRVRATDVVGNEETLPSAHAWSVYQAPPLPPQVVFPTEQPYYTNEPDIELRVSLCEGCGLLVDDSLSDGETVDGVWRLSRLLVPGLNHFVFSTQGGDGVESEEQAVDIIFDDTKPVALIDEASVIPAGGWKAVWRGSDQYDGLLYDVDYRAGASAWHSWLNRVAETEGIVAQAETGLPVDAVMGFRVRAYDRAGNVGVWSEEITTAAAVPSSNPIRLWHFDECFGETVERMSGEHVAPPGNWTVGKYGCGVSQSWPGNEQVYWPLSVPIPSSELSVAFYMKAPYGSAGHIWLIDAAGRIAAGAWPTAPAVRAAINGGYPDMPPPPINRWTQVHIVYSAQHLDWYIDGQRAQRLDGDYRLLAPLTAVAIGQENFLWQLDELVIWPRALTEDEIVSQVTGPNEPRTLRASQVAAQLVHYWNFDEAAGPAIDTISATDVPAVFRTAGWRGNAMYTNWRPGYQVSVSLPALVSPDVSLSYWRRDGPESGGGNGKVVLGSSQPFGPSFGTSGGVSRTYIFHNQGYSDIGAALPSDTSWHHIALVYDSYAYELRYYIDGVLRSAIPAIWRAGDLDWLSIDEDQGFFSVDELKIWTGALTPEQVLSLAQTEARQQ